VHEIVLVERYRIQQNTAQFIFFLELKGPSESNRDDKLHSNMLELIGMDQID